MLPTLLQHSSTRDRIWLIDDFLLIIYQLMEIRAENNISTSFTDKPGDSDKECLKRVTHQPLEIVSLV
jgi:hypothetical protein